MKIKIEQYENYWDYCIDELKYTQKEYDYIFKYLYFDKLDKDDWIKFSNKTAEEWFCKTYINTNYLKAIYHQSPEGYQYLKNNWGKGVFKLYVYYTDKQELKTIVNKTININMKHIRNKQ